MQAPTLAVQAELHQYALCHLNALYGFARSLTHNQMDAEDLVHDAYLRAARHFHRFRPGSNFRAWMYTIIRNLFINNRRRRSARALHLDVDTFTSGLSQADPTARLDAEIEVHNGAVRDALDRLPEVYRTALWLNCMESLSYKHIAGIMGTPVGTVMSRLHRARKLLRESLAHEAVPSRHGEDQGSSLV